ncbi:MAG: putative toxin-antitoxin system toxin component, PIN family [Candidatus Sumerlaeaceae bacterium]|nr:putative toxin-antitoxin system toxin component, PIN family [Candidatus Sumerlaeaceae bacterium]
MGSPRKVAPPRRAVFDTNTVISALLFSSGRLAWLREEGAAGRAIPVVCAETVSELLRVLSYPKFRLTPGEQEILLGDYLPYAETARLLAKWPPTPRCRDKCDQVFLALASHAKADALVTGDSDLLALEASFDVPILTPEVFRRSGP